MLGSIATPPLEELHRTKTPWQENDCAPGCGDLPGPKSAAKQESPQWRSIWDSR